MKIDFLTEPIENAREHGSRDTALNLHSGVKMFEFHSEHQTSLTEGFRVYTSFPSGKT
jgi:hypothetical protein